MAKGRRPRSKLVHMSSVQGASSQQGISTCVSLEEGFLVCPEMPEEPVDTVHCWPNIYPLARCPPEWSSQYLYLQWHCQAVDYCSNNAHKDDTIIHDQRPIWIVVRGCPSSFAITGTFSREYPSLRSRTFVTFAAQVCWTKYGSYPVHRPYCHEAAVRILLACMETHANRYKRHITPLLSMSVDFYVRVFVRVRHLSGGWVTRLIGRWVCTGVWDM